MFKHEDYFMMRYKWYRSLPRREVKVGSKFGKWTVIENVKYEHPDWDYDPNAIWKCQCECYSGTIAHMSSDRLNKIERDKKKFHAGCWHCRNREQERLQKMRNEEHYRKTYKAWHNLCSRCLKPEHKLYNNYGGRGITVCDEWKNDFLSFYSYVSALEHYGDPGRSIDRIDNDKGYFPGNVRWATAKEQANNQRHRKKKS